MTPVLSIDKPPRRVRPRKRGENAIQADVIRYLHAVLPPSKWIIYANANASRRTASGKASNAVPGLLPGIPDVSIVTIGGRAFYFEVKTATGVLSEPQEAIRDRMRRMQVPWFLVRSVDDVQNALRSYQIKTREAA